MIECDPTLGKRGPDGAPVRYPAPARVLTVPYGDEGLQIRPLQAVLQQLLGGVDVLRDALHALVQHPRALADLALGSEAVDGGNRFGGEKKKKKDGKLGGGGVENVLQIGKNDA